MEWALDAMRRNGITPLLALRDGALNPKFLKQKFGSDGGAILLDAAAKSNLARAPYDSDPKPNGLLYREGLAPFFEVVAGGKADPAGPGGEPALPLGDGGGDPAGVLPVLCPGGHPADPCYAAAVPPSLAGAGAGAGVGGGQDLALLPGAAAGGLFLGGEVFLHLALENQVLHSLYAA